MKQQLPRELYRAGEVRALDRCAIDEFGIAGMTLMQRAGQAAFRIIQRRWPQAQRVLVCCGGGSNGGDGYVVAMLAQRAGLDVTVLYVTAPDVLPGDAYTAMQQARAAGVPMQPFPVDAPLPPADLVVDALLGTGFSGELRDRLAAVIAAINAAGAPVLALDLPSGLDADTGMAPAGAVQASATITFVGLKRGLFTGSAPALCGDIHFDDLQLPAAARARVPASAQRLGAGAPGPQLPARPRDAHKGRFGHVLVVGGDDGFGGAALLAAEAALRCGAGLVSVATRPAHVAACLARRPELMVHGVQHPAELEPLLARASVVVVGPGLGQAAWGRGLLAKVLASSPPLVLDADALNLLASGGPASQRAAERRRAHGGAPDWILTPHPGEAARLLGIGVAQVQQDRFAALQALQQRYGGAVLLKGAGTLVDGGDGALPAVIDAGNPGMASGGMGDVLSGVLGALLAQQLAPGDAARLGALLHAAAADAVAARHGERGLLAADLAPVLQSLVNGHVPGGAGR